MQSRTSKIAHFRRSFNIEPNSLAPSGGPGGSALAKEKITFSEYQGFGEPLLNLGIIGDIYIDITTGNCALYAKLEDGWKKWPGPRQRTVCLDHPVYSSHVLWCRVERSMLGWIPKTAVPRVLMSSSQAISSVLHGRRSTFQKSIKNRLKGTSSTAIPATAKLRFSFSDSSSSSTIPDVNISQDALPDYLSSAPPSATSTVTFIEKSSVPQPNPDDLRLQINTEISTTRGLRRTTKVAPITHNAEIPTPELDDLIQESQFILDTISGAAEGRPNDVAPAPPQTSPAKPSPHPHEASISPEKQGPSASPAQSPKNAPGRTPGLSTPNSSSKSLSKSAGKSPAPSSPMRSNLYSLTPSVKEPEMPIRTPPFGSPPANKPPSWAMIDDEGPEEGGSGSLHPAEGVLQLGKEKEKLLLDRSPICPKATTTKRPISAARKMPSLAKTYPSSPPSLPHLAASPANRAGPYLIGTRSAPVSAARKWPSWTMEVEEEPEVGQEMEADEVVRSLLVDDDDELQTSSPWREKGPASAQPVVTIQPKLSSADAEELLTNLKVMPRLKFKRQTGSYKRPATIDKKEKARREAMNKVNAGNVIDLTMDEDEDDSDGRGVKPLLLAKLGGKVPSIPNTQFKHPAEPHKQAAYIDRARREAINKANASDVVDLTMDEEDEDNGRGVKPLPLAKQASKVLDTSEVPFQPIIDLEAESEEVDVVPDYWDEEMIDMPPHAYMMEQESQTNGSDTEESSTNTADQTDELKEDSESEGIIIPHSPQRFKRRNVYGSCR